MKKTMAIFNSSPLTTSYGGVGPFMKNIDFYLKNNYDIVYINMPAFVHDINFIPRRLTYFLYVFIKFSSFKKYDILLSHVPEASYILTYLNKPLIHIFHGNYNPMSQSRFWFGRYMKSVFAHFDARILKNAQLKYTVGNQRIGVNKIINPISHKINIKEPKDRNGFAFAGRLERIKNIDKIIEAYSLLPSEIIKKEKLYILGEGSQDTFLKKLVLEKSLNEQIKFTGSLSNEHTISLISDRKILLMASSQEGMPMAIAESLSVGVPVVATDTGDISKFIINGYNGFVLPLDYSLKDYIHCIDLILNDYEQFSANAFQSSQQFKAESVVNDLANDINQIF